MSKGIDFCSPRTVTRFVALKLLGKVLLDNPWNIPQRPGGTGNETTILPDLNDVCLLQWLGMEAGEVTNIHRSCGGSGFDALG